jgi:MoaA/NifB/PqqE/SkfB family radical SAM enzyme
MQDRVEGGDRGLLLQAESALACNISCVMCPWKGERAKAGAGLMPDDVWSAIRPHLRRFRHVDLSGGGEPLLNPALAERLAEAKHAGCTAGFLTNATLLDRDAAARILDSGPDWIGVSLDGATAGTYESVRKGADFGAVTGNIERLAAMRRGDRPAIVIQAVMMPENLAELPDLVGLAAGLGARRIVLKNCDVVRSEGAQARAVYSGGGAGSAPGRKKILRLAAKRARKAGVELAAYSLEPEEEPACEQDPRRSLFVGHDGRVAACIGLAYGGPGRFFGREVEFPQVLYGRLPGDGLMECFESDRARKYCETFEQRERAYMKVLSGLEGDVDLIKLRRTLDKAVDSMPPAPEGCDRCHYLYGV